MFDSDIRNLLSMDQMWKSKDRVPPVPLDFDKIADGTFSLPDASQAESVNGSAKNKDGAEDIEAGNNDKHASTQQSQNGLKDQKKLSLQECLVLFVSR